MASQAIRAGAAFVELLTKDRMAAGLESAERRLRSFATRVNQMGRNLAAAGIAAGTPIGFSLRTFAVFEDEMARIRAITGATGTDFERLTAKARELGKSTSFTATEVAQAMRFLAMAGFSVDKIMAGIGITLATAKAGATDLAFTADTVSDVAQAFGLGADEIERVGDVIAKAATSANTDIEKMAVSFKFLAPIAATAGQSMEQMAGAIATLGDAGIKAHTAGTNMERIFKRLVMKDVQEALDELGVTIADDSGNFKDLTEIVSALAVKLRGMPEVEQLRFLSENFGLAAKSMAVLIRDSEKLEGMVDKMFAAEGAAQKMADIIANTLMGAWKEFMSAIGDLQIELGTLVKDEMEAFTDKVRDITRHMATLLASFPELSRIVVRTIAGILALAAGLIVLAGALKIAAFGFGILKSAVLLVGTILSNIMFAIAGLATIPGLVAIATVAIAALIADWTGLTDVMRKSWTHTWKQIISDFTIAWEGIGAAIAAGDLKLAWDQIVLYLKIQWKQFMLNTKSITHSAMNGVIDIWDTAVTNIAAFFLKLWNKLKEGWVDFKLWSIKLIHSMVVSMASAFKEIPGLGNLFPEDIEEAAGAHIMKMMKKAIADKAELAGEMGEIDKLFGELDKRILDRENERLEGMEGAEAELEALRNQLEALRDLAKKKLEIKLEAVPEEDLDEEIEKMKKRELRLKEAGFQIGNPGSVFGTFSAAGAVRLGGGGDRVQQEQLQTQREIVQAVDDATEAIENIDIADQLTFTA